MGETCTVGIIGCNRMGKLHAKGYAAEPRTRVVALSDVEQERAEALAEAHGFPATVYGDYHELLAADELPDMVSICLWTKQHLPAIRDCVAAGIRVIHCEKPMAPTWGEARQIAALAREAGVRLTFNHQRRFSPSFAAAREMLHGGEVGDLERVEAFNPANILDWGTHILDLIHMFNRESPAVWVMGQVDAREVKRWFDVPFEFAALASVRFANGVRAILHSGDDKEMNLGLRLVASRGVIELRGESTLRWLRYGDGQWREKEFEGGPQDRGPIAIRGAVKNLIDTLESGAEPELGFERALRGAEVIFAVYESCRRRARVDLPLDTDDNPFIALLDQDAFPD